MAVSALSADRVYRDPSSLTLPAGTSNIQIDFAVFAFSNPRSTRARYRIEGQDPDWIGAGTRRQAFYTNLSPGTYRFQVMRERAVQIGAELSLWSEVGAGTEVELRVPGAMAYSAPGGRGTPPSPPPASQRF